MHSSFDFNILRARVLIREKTVAAIIAIAAAALFMPGSQTDVVEAQNLSGTPYNAQPSAALSGGISYPVSNSQPTSSSDVPPAHLPANLLAQSPEYNNSSATTASESIPQPSMLSQGASVPTGLQTCTFRFAWTGTRHTWRGQIEVVNPTNPSAPGAILEATSLGLEADQAAAYSVRQGVLYIHHPSSREYDGYNVCATGQKGCKVRITLTADNQEPQTFDINWEDLFYQAFQFNVYDAKATLRRTSGDFLRLDINRDNLVYSPGESFIARLTPYELAADGLTDYNPATIKVRLQHTRENFEVYEKEYSWIPQTGGDILLNIPLPQEEGVYDVVITASCRKVGAILPRVTDAVNKQLENAHLQSPKELASRKVQLTVIDPTNAPSEQTGAMETRLTAEIDPANPRWWEPLERLSQIPLGLRGKQWEYPLGNGSARVSQCELGPITELAANRPSENPCWEAYTFPIERMGVPHILEIEYPSNSEQTTGISIIEPNAAGAITPGNVDSGFNVTVDSQRSLDKPTWKTHKIVFWPRTKSPVVVIYNLREDVVSRYGKIRVMSVIGKLPKTYSGTSPRLLAAYLDRPQFPAMFSAKKTASENATMALDNWETFYDGASRMVEYLNFVGYNGAMISVNSDGSSIWPCPEVAPTPRYDTGIFSQSCSDPMRKDALEALMRMFDRQQMQLIPAIEITQPVPDLEAKVRTRDPQTSGLQWIGPDGKTILSAYPPENGAAMYYNILHPEVQQFILNMVSHLTSRYKNHAAFTGLGLQLTDNSWLVLPPPQWGMDDETIRRFTADTGVRVPGEGAERFQVRARFLNGPAQAHWLKWRSDKLSEFYCQLRDRLQADGSNRKLYLSGAKLFTRCHKNALLPKIPQTTGVQTALLQCGLSPDFGLGAKQNIVLTYTQRVINGQTLRQSAAQRQWNVMPDADAFFSSHNGQRIQASLFYHPSHQIRLTDFEKKSPYKPTFALLNSIPTPAGIENRKRFIQSLALWDTQEFFDGGWTFALGEEESVVNTMAAFRCLANRPYNEAISGERTLSATNNDDSNLGRVIPATQNQSNAIVCRWISDGQSTWAYAINTTPYRIAGKIRLNLASAGGTPPSASYRLDNVLYRFSELNNKGSAFVDNVPELVYENVAPLNPDSSIDESKRPTGADFGNRAAARTGSGASPQLIWRSYFAPFEIQVVRFNAPVQPSRPEVVWSQQTIDQMRTSLVDLVNRAESLKTARTMRSLDNPDFEQPADNAQPIPKWFVWKNPNQPETSASGASIDSRTAASGKNSLHLACDGWPTAVYSKEIAADATGRFTVSMWVKKDPNVPLRCFIRAKCGNKNVYREMLICREPEDPTANQQGGWRQHFFHINDLPLENMDNLCLGFELPQKGEAWIDNINVSDLYFSEYEQRELYKTLLPLKDKFAQGELEYCWRYEQGYWPQFLKDCVELRNAPSAPLAVAAPHSSAIGLSADSAFGKTPVTQTPPSAQPTQLSGTNQKKTLFGFGKNPNVAVPTPSQSAPSPEPTAPQPKKEPEKKTFLQRATDWWPWK